MATAASILGKVKPLATTATTLYTCPSSTEAVCNVWACNQSATASAIRIAVVKYSDSLADTDYIYYDQNLYGNQTLKETGITLDAGDFIVVYTANATVSFVAMGMETT